MKIMAHRGFRHLPVVSDGNLSGIITAGDLINTFTSVDLTKMKARDSSIEDTSKRESEKIISSLNLHVEDVKSSQPVSIKASATILDAIRLMSEKNIGSLLIVEDEAEKQMGSRHGTRLLGIVTLRDIISILSAYGPFGIRVEDCMTRRVATTNERNSIYSAMELMAREGVRRLPVVAMTRNRDSGEAVLGMVTNKMILRYLESVISYNMVDMEKGVIQPVKTVMHPSMPSIDPKEDCGNAAYLMRELGTGGFAVIDSRELVGVITERDLVRRIYEKEGLSFFTDLFGMGNGRMQI